jgi:hypothetical protein
MKCKLKLLKLAAFAESRDRGIFCLVGTLTWPANCARSLVEVLQRVIACNLKRWRASGRWAVVGVLALSLTCTQPLTVSASFRPRGDG